MKSTKSKISTTTIDMDKIKKAQILLNEAEAILILAGAGMGVDSGMPDFRGTKGFWSSYPKAQELGLRFEELANPKWFISDPHLAWAFYGHRLHLYRNTVPHKGFARLLELSNGKKYKSFIFTSNVDGQFQKAGFDESRIMECHGSIHHLQCIDNCRDKIWSASETIVNIDDDFRAKDPLPLCPYCGGVARPNILMFGDFGWSDGRTSHQNHMFAKWIDELEQDGAKLAVIEFGAGRAVPTVRNMSEQIARGFGVPMIRINPRESMGAQIDIPLGAVDALDLILA